MRDSSYAPRTAEELIEAIPITGNLDHFWKDLLELEENGDIIKTLPWHLRTARENGTGG